MNKQHTPQDTLIAFDLHEVIVRPTYGKLIRYGLNKLPKRLALYAFWPAFWVSLIKARKDSRVPEVIYNNLCKKYPRLEEIRPHFIAMSNMQKLHPDMVRLIQDLKKRNYPIYLFSNIGPETLKDLRTKLPLDGFLDEFFSPQNDDDFCHKPHPEFYTKFKDFVASKLPNHKTIIFVDDKRVNINKAEEAGLIGIRFKSPKQLKKELASLC